MQNAILQLLENPFISCLFCLQKGVSAHICVGQKGTSSVYFCPCYKSWFQMYEKKTSFYFNSSMLLWCHLRMWGNPLRKWGLHQGGSHQRFITKAQQWLQHGTPNHCPGPSGSMTQKTGVKKHPDAVCFNQSLPTSADPHSPRSGVNSNTLWDVVSPCAVQLIWLLRQLALFDVGLQRCHRQAAMETFVFIYWWPAW